MTTIGKTVAGQTKSKHVLSIAKCHKPRYTAQRGSIFILTVNYDTYSAVSLFRREGAWILRSPGMVRQIIGNCIGSCVCTGGPNLFSSSSIITSTQQQQLTGLFRLTSNMGEMMYRRRMYRAYTWHLTQQCGCSNILWQLIFPSLLVCWASTLSIRCSDGLISDGLIKFLELVYIYIEYQNKTRSETDIVFFKDNYRLKQSWFPQEEQFHARKRA